MSLKALRKFHKTIGFKVTAWYSSFFILSSLLLVLISYYFLSSTLKNHDRVEIMLEAKEIASLYEIGGIIALQDFVIQNQSSRRAKPLFIRVAGGHNKTRHIFSAEQWHDFNLAALETIFPSCNTPWISLSASEGSYVLEIMSAQLSEGYWVQVGISSEGREKVLGQFRKIFLVVMIPLFALGLGGGIFLSNKTLQPIRNIIETVSSLDVSKMATKVPRTMTGDELDKLADLFNTMIDNIHRLILGMKNSLDNVAHDLRTPMTRLRNISETALRADDDTDLLRNALEKGIEESDRIIRMLDTLMDISEAETGTMSIDRKMANISILIEKVADMYQFVAEEKGIDFQVTIPEELSAPVDSNRISQVVANIIDNAIKFTPQGGTIRLEAEYHDDDIMICVEDTGQGIEKEDLSRIWDRLYRGDQSRSEKGLGLGLSLVKGIVTAHGGRIDVVSEPSKGSAFTIYI